MAISTDIPKTPKENTNPYPSDPSTPTNKRLVHNINGPSPRREQYIIRLPDDNHHRLHLVTTATREELDYI